MANNELTIALAVSSGLVISFVGGVAPASADHSYTPNYSIVTWNSSGVPSGNNALQEWRQRMESTYRRGFSRGSTSCVLNPFASGCGYSFVSGGKRVWIPEEFSSSTLGKTFASSYMRSVRVQNAAINVKTGGKEMNLSVKIAFDGESLGRKAPLRRTTLLWAPDKKYRRNLAMQCEKGAYPATGNKAFRRNNVWGLTREFRFDTDREACDKTIMARAFGKFAGEDYMEDQVINTGDFPNPVEMVVMSGNRAAAYVRCSRSTKKCDWTYPSLWERDQAKNSRQVQQVKTAKKYAANNPADYKDTVHAGWLKNFTNADMIKSQPVVPAQDVNFTIAAQSMSVLIDACSAAPSYLSTIQSDSGLSGLSNLQVAKVNFADNCLKNPLPGGGMASFPASIVVHPKSVGRSGMGNEMTSVCNFLPSAVRQNLAGQLSRLGLTRTAYCFTQG